MCSFECVFICNTESFGSKYSCAPESKSNIWPLKINIDMTAEKQLNPSYSWGRQDFVVRVSGEDWLWNYDVRWGNGTEVEVTTIIKVNNKTQCEQISGTAPWQIINTSTVCRETSTVNTKAYWIAQQQQDFGHHVLHVCHSCEQKKGFVQGLS